jgi:ribose-phosphate pyrophosphokinase
VLSGPALQRITDSALAEVVVTDTISHENLEERCPKITSLSAAALFAEAISRINSGRSISSLFI